MPKNKKQADKKPDSANGVPAENVQTGTAAAIKNSGNFIISGTYKEEDSGITINLYVSDAENGRGYYARRINIPFEKMPELFKNKETTNEVPTERKDTEEISGLSSQENGENRKDEIIEKINKAIIKGKHNKADKPKENAPSETAMPIPASDNDDGLGADPLEGQPL